MKTVKLEMCVGTTCHLMGSHDLIDVVENLPDWMKERIDYSLSPCFDVCNSGMKPPIVRINGEYIENVTPDVLREKIEEMLRGGS